MNLCVVFIGLYHVTLVKFSWFWVYVAIQSELIDLSLVDQRVKWLLCYSYSLLFYWNGTIVLSDLLSSLFLLTVYTHNSSCKSLHFSSFLIKSKFQKVLHLWIVAFFWVLIQPALFHSLDRYHLQSPLRMSVNSRSADVGRGTLTFRSRINLTLVKIHRQLVQTVRSVGFSCN